MTSLSAMITIIEITFRFLCIILGPHEIKEPLHAMGRVLGALMSDQVSSLVLRVEQQDRPNSQTNLDFSVHVLCQYNSLHLGVFGIGSFPSTNDLHTMLTEC